METTSGGISSDENQLTQLADDLKKEYGRRSEASRRYSLRSFAKDVGVSVSVVSTVFAGKRKLSKLSVEKICFRLGWDSRNYMKGRPSVDGWQSSETAMATGDSLPAIYEWYHRAILHMAAHLELSADATVVAERLAIPVDWAERAITELTRDQYLTREGQRLTAIRSL